MVCLIHLQMPTNVMFMSLLKLSDLISGLGIPQLLEAILKVVAPGYLRPPSSMEPNMIQSGVFNIVSCICLDLIKCPVLCVVVIFFPRQQSWILWIVTNRDV